MKIGTGILKIVATSALLGGIAVGGTAAAAGLAQVHGNVSPMLTRATVVRHHSVSAKLNISIALPLQNQDQLAQFLHDLHDRSSSSYHKFLKPGEFAQLYGPSAGQVQAVEDFLTQHGIPARSISVSPNRTRVMFTATTAAVESAFGVAINDYTVDGATFYSASGDPSLPADLHVKAVFGLDDAVQWKPHNIQNLHPAPRGRGAGPSGYGPQQIATAYDWPNPNAVVDPLTDTSLASGVTIAIATAFTYRPQDVQKFWDTYGLPHHTLSNVPINGTTHVLNGETTLDIERSSSMSPGSAIKVYECSTPANANFDAEFQAIATADTEQVVSTSWGLNETQSGLASIGAEHDAFVQMATQGQTVMAAAGDDGSNDRFSGNNGDNADFPSSDPFVIAAGGTTLFLDNTNFIVEEDAWSGAGGADSLYFAEPSFQTSAAGWVSNTNCSEDVTSDSNYVDDQTGVCTAAGAPSRQSSDISMDADPSTGYSIYYNGRWEVFGGTSFVAPELAGFFAILAGQDITINSATGFEGSGPELVFCAAATNPSGDFHDITSGSNGNFSAGTGWDHPTGWGSPDAALLAGDLAASCVVH